MVSTVISVLKRRRRTVMDKVMNYSRRWHPVTRGPTRISMETKRSTDTVDLKTINRQHLMRSSGTPGVGSESIPKLNKNNKLKHEVCYGPGPEAGR